MLPDLDPNTLRWVANDLDAEAEIYDRSAASSARDAETDPIVDNRPRWRDYSSYAKGQAGDLRSRATRYRKIATRMERRRARG